METFELANVMLGRGECEMVKIFTEKKINFRNKVLKDKFGNNNLILQ